MKASGNGQRDGPFSAIVASQEITYGDCQKRIPERTFGG